MIKNTNKTTCNCNNGCDHVDAKKPTENTSLGYGFYSNVLKKPFDNLAELKRAEEVYYAELKAKEDKASQKKADAQKVEDAFKALNAARKEYKEKLTQLTQEYANELANLEKAFKLGKTDIQNALAAAEETYSKALKEFTDKHESYHLTLRDGDFETTISGSSKVNTNASADANKVFNIFDLLFNI